MLAAEDIAAVVSSPSLISSKKQISSGDQSELDRRKQGGLW